MNSLDEEVYFLQKITIRADEGNIKQFNFRANIPVEAKNTIILDIWADVLCNKKYLQLEKAYDQALFYKQPFEWKLPLFNYKHASSFIALSIQVEPRSGEKFVVLNTINESNELLKELVYEINKIITIALNLAFESGRMKADPSMFYEEGFQFYLAFIHFSNTIFAKNYLLGKHISGFLKEFEKQDMKRFDILYRFMTEVFNSVCRDYNISSSNPTWILSYGFEIIETIVSQLLYSHLRKIYELQQSKRIQLSHILLEEGLPCKNNNFIVNMWELLAINASMINKLMFLEEIYFTVHLARLQEDYNEISNEKDIGLLIVKSLLETPSVTMLIGDLFMLRDFLVESNMIDVNETTLLHLPFLIDLLKNLE